MPAASAEEADAVASSKATTKYGTSQIGSAKVRYHQRPTQAHQCAMAAELEMTAHQPREERARRGVRVDQMQAPGHHGESSSQDRQSSVRPRQLTRTPSGGRG